MPAHDLGERGVFEVAQRVSGLTRLEPGEQVPEPSAFALPFRPSISARDSAGLDLRVSRRRHPAVQGVHEGLQLATQLLDPGRIGESWCSLLRSRAVHKQGIAPTSPSSLAGEGCSAKPRRMRGPRLPIRHARPCGEHPRLDTACYHKDVDGRYKPDHDDEAIARPLTLASPARERGQVALFLTPHPQPTLPHAAQSSPPSRRPRRHSRPRRCPFSPLPRCRRG